MRTSILKIGAVGMSLAICIATICLIKAQEKTYTYTGTAEAALPVVTESVTDEEITTESLAKSYDWDEEEAYLLAKIAMAEAEGESTEGKALVILVVLNRVWSDAFPDTIEEVIYQSGQFTPVENGRFDKVEPDDDCWQALQMVTGGWDESQGATYFESVNSTSTWHRDHLAFLFRYGNHLFYIE